jgi:hypothetical protein
MGGNIKNWKVKNQKFLKDGPEYIQPFNIQFSIFNFEWFTRQSYLIKQN